MLFHVVKMIGKRAEQILKKYKVSNPELKFQYSKKRVRRKQNHWRNELFRASAIV